MSELNHTVINDVFKAIDPSIHKLLYKKGLEDTFELVNTWLSNTTLVVVIDYPCEIDSDDSINLRLEFDFDMSILTGQQSLDCVELDKKAGLIEKELPDASKVLLRCLYAIYAGCVTTDQMRVKWSRYKSIQFQTNGAKRDGTFSVYFR